MIKKSVLTNKYSQYLAKERLTNIVVAVVLKEVALLIHSVMIISSILTMITSSASLDKSLNFTFLSHFISA